MTNTPKNNPNTSNAIGIKERIKSITNHPGENFEAQTYKQQLNEIVANHDEDQIKQILISVANEIFDEQNYAMFNGGRSTLNIKLSILTSQRITIINILDTLNANTRKESAKETLSSLSFLKGLNEKFASQTEKQGVKIEMKKEFCAQSIQEIMESLDEGEITKLIQSFDFSEPKHFEPRNSKISYIKDKNPNTVRRIYKFDDTCNIENPTGVVAHFNTDVIQNKYGKIIANINLEWIFGQSPKITTLLYGLNHITESPDSNKFDLNNAQQIKEWNSAITNKSGQVFHPPGGPQNNFHENLNSLADLGLVTICLKGELPPQENPLNQEMDEDFILTGIYGDPNLFTMGIGNGLFTEAFNQAAQYGFINLKNFR